MVTRRVMAASIGAMAISGLLPGCVRRVEPICLSDPRFTYAGRLTIDTHAHVFNATDLQIKAFLLRVLIPEMPALKPLAGLIQHLAWKGAPTAEQELLQLAKVRDALATCDTSVFQSQDNADFEQQFRTAVRRLDQAYARSRADPRTARLTSSAVGDKIEQLKATSAADYRRRHASGLRTTARSYSFDGGIDFIIRNFQYRYVNVLDYLRTYSVTSPRKFDLIVPALVDYDWPIASGGPTPSSLNSQFRVMAEITRITGGRVHSLAPYCPLKHVAHDLGIETENPLHAVQRAVLTHGFLGVKLYPPMGFKPFGNANLPDRTWNVSWLPDSIKIPGLGKRIDAGLAELYDWCLREDIPIMAHTNRSNYPSESDGSSPFKDFINPGYWKNLLDAFPGLRLNFGHFGNTELQDNELPNSELLAELMTKEDGSSGQNVFADSSYFTEIVSEPARLKSALRKLYRATANSNTAPVATRLMYGSDWEMIEAEGEAQKQYFSQFQKIYAALDRETGLGSAGKLSDDFFGLNAARFLGLARGDKARERLDTFYMGSRKPIWMRKVDGDIA